MIKPYYIAGLTNAPFHYKLTYFLINKIWLKTARNHLNINIQQWVQSKNAMYRVPVHHSGNPVQSPLLLLFKTKHRFMLNDSLIQIKPHINS